MKHPIICSAVLLLTALLMATCGPAPSTQGPTTWIDEPLDGSQLPLQPMEIMAHASDSDGVSSFDFYVDGALLAHASATDIIVPADLYTTGGWGPGYLASTTVGWDPKTPGIYTIAVRATDAKGNGGSEAGVVVTVGQPQGSPMASPTLVPTEETVPPGTPAPSVPTKTPGPPTPTPPFPTATPVPPTPTPPFPTATPVPPTATPPPPAIPAQIAYFEANPGTINAGGCSTLSWGVDYAAAVYLDGEGVIGHDARQVCPATTTTYTLYATSGGGDDQATATVTVIQAPTPTPIPTSTPVVDTTPPEVSGLYAMPDSITADISPCTGQTTIIAVTAHDPHGVAKVVVYWTLASQNGQKNMTPNPQSGDFYEEELGPFDNTGNLLVTVVAWDPFGNSASIGPITVVVHAIC